MVTVGVKGLYW